MLTRPAVCSILLAASFTAVGAQSQATGTATHHRHTQSPKAAVTSRSPGTHKTATHSKPSAPTVRSGSHHMTGSAPAKTSHNTHEAAAHSRRSHPAPAKARSKAGPKAVAPAAAAAAAAAATAVAAPPSPPDNKGTVTGLPLPRFAALRAEDVNLRSGPGTRYPIQWVYHRRDLPVRVEREFDVWRLIEDTDGVKGWVNQATLVGSRGFVTDVPLALMRDAPSATGGLIAIVRSGVVGRLLRCDAPAPGAQAEPLAGAAGALPVADSAPVGPPAAPGSTVDPDAKAKAAADGEEAPKLPPVSAEQNRPTVSGTDGLDAVVAQAVAEAQAGTTHPAPADAQPGWCRVRIRDYTGWLPRDAVYGILPGEVIAPS